ncbi:hypothetical protein EDD55_10785 [Varunaivibrio sulfuroxidans]|uniref:Uncharacterized protein n=1 Tax=Varunaivibrio sulfuroxidans TaxID=1773489 RepID=A0A4R3J9J5_9PROT|nr:hypothetical protein EDD55_10785 [Varunaivibrio sulfuroxidans]
MPPSAPGSCVNALSRFLAYMVVAYMVVVRKMALEGGVR